MIWELKMPRLDEDMVEGTVTRWLKKEGEPVQKGEVILEIETQKINFQVEAPGAGYLYIILAKEGELVPINGLVGVIGELGDDLNSYRSIHKEEKQKETQTGDSSAPAPLPLRRGPVERERVLISPVARNLAQKWAWTYPEIHGSRTRRGGSPRKMF